VVVLAAAFVLVTAHTALAQRADIYEGKIDGVEIAVLNLGVPDQDLKLKPGETLEIAPGQRVQLRPYSPRDGNPTGRRQYLAAEFTLEGQSSDWVDIVETDRPFGKAVIHVRPRGAGHTATIRYRLTGNLELARAGLGQGVIRLAIDEHAGVAPPVASPGAPPDAPRRGVTLYEDSLFRGESETIFEDRPDLRYSRIRNDRASSIQVPEGCEVTLYRDTNYQGRVAVLRAHATDLGKTEVGNDAVSSLRIRCD
jgi:hypothetical protein